MKVWVTLSRITHTIPTDLSVWCAPTTTVSQSQLAGFNGPATGRNGVWALWVRDHAGQYAGVIAGAVEPDDLYLADVGSC